MNIAAIIVGIENWAKYTLPLIQSLQKHEPECPIVAIDNFSDTPYPHNGVFTHWASFVLRPTGRYCYSQAINIGASEAREFLELHDETIDWYIVLSNDVICTGPFAHLLAPLPPCVVGPQLWHEHGLDWIVGWAVFVHREVWDAVGGWDEQYKMSSWEDVDLSVSAVEHGYPLLHMPALPFVHLDQKQRFGLPGYAGSEAHNYQYFRAKHVKMAA